MLSNNKILPLYFNNSKKNEKNKKICCICYENKKKYTGWGSYVKNNPKKIKE